jgi:Domain of unknown function (DUF4349)
MDRFDDDTLLAELREIRPEPRSEFAAELDEWAAAGFPRRDPRPGTGRFATLAAHLRDLRAKSARQWLVPALGLTIAVLATVGVVVAIGSNGGSGGNLMTSAPSQEGGGGAVESESAEAGDEAVETESGGEEVSGPTEAESGVHSGEVLPKKSASKAESVEAQPAEEAEDTMHAGEESSEEAEESSEAAGAEESIGGGAAGVPSYNATAKASPVRVHREVERSSSIVLGTKPDQVAGAAAKVYAAVHAAGGIVLNSSVESGSTGSSGASFSLLIPSGKVDDALAAFSRIAEVRSRHDATQDITKPTVGVTEELRDSNASIEGLLKELGSAETEGERESVEARLREERRRHASIRASLEHLHKRASLSEVSLRIVTGHGAGAVPVGKGKSGGDWSVGDALHDAGHILTIVAGVALIGLAILAPFALIALLLWSLNRFRVRRLRERALG